MADAKPSVEDAFRDGLLDVQTVIERLAPICVTIDDLLGAVKAARENDCILRLVLKEIQSKK